MSNNAWTANSQHGKTQQALAAPEEPRVITFNAQEVRECLKQAFDTSAPSDAKALNYKAPGGQANNTRPGGAWSAKAGTMASNKDFFQELRKQISTLQQGERAGG